MARTPLSILFPHQERITYTVLPEESLHDLGLDVIVDKVTDSGRERALLLRILGSVTADPEVAIYRTEVFDDIYHHPEIRNRLMKLLEHIRFLNDYGAVHRSAEEAAGLWDLMHRLDEISDYIATVEAIQECLQNAELHSAGLQELRAGIATICEDSCFDALRQDIAALRTTTDKMQSITIGINLNERFEAVQAGLVSVNSKPFTKSSLLRSFSDAILRKDQLHNDTEWNGDMTWHPASSGFGNIVQRMEQVTTRAMRVSNPIAAMTMAGVPDGDGVRELPRTLDAALNNLVTGTVRRLREVLSKYATVSLKEISDLIPELVYYVRWAEYIEKLRNAGWAFCKPEVSSQDTLRMRAKDFWNVKLTLAEAPENVVPNDLDFADATCVYLLTGANRGGKTTVTQAVGQLFLLAQGGIYVPASAFTYQPTDGVYTHFPADEDKTLDLGRLGEECKRFRDLYTQATNKSLLLLNETFSTTSFEEGYYIACDAVRAILRKGARTIYNTHMHKLAGEMDGKVESGWKSLSLVVQSEAGKRSFRIAVAPPGGSSYAKDIAEKYGVTFEDLISGT